MSVRTLLLFCIVNNVCSTIFNIKEKKINKGSGMLNLFINLNLVTYMAIWNYGIYGM